MWLAGDGALIDPWILGSADENDVQGQGATPINVNNFTFGYRHRRRRGGTHVPAAEALLDLGRLRA